VPALGRCSVTLELCALLKPGEPLHKDSRTTQVPFLPSTAMPPPPLDLIPPLPLVPSYRALLQSIPLQTDETVRTPYSSLLSYLLIFPQLLNAFFHSLNYPVPAFSQPLPTTVLSVGVAFKVYYVMALAVRDNPQFFCNLP